MATNLNFHHNVAGGTNDFVGAQHAAPQLARPSTRRPLSSIRALKSNVSQSDALRKFSTAGPASIFRNFRLGPLQRIAQVYVPFHLYRVNYTLAREHQSRLFAIDAVQGSLDLFEFPAPPRREELLQIETRNALPVTLSDETSQGLLREKVLRVIFQQGFFKLREANLTIERIPLDLHLSYWLAFHGRESATGAAHAATSTVRCRILDATRNRIEGAKAAALFESWLSA
jgi:hypothetical protein